MFSVSDGRGGTDTETITLTVTNAGDVPLNLDVADDLSDHAVGGDDEGRP